MDAEVPSVPSFGARPAPSCPSEEAAGGRAISGRRYGSSVWREEKVFSLMEQESGGMGGTSGARENCSKQLRTVGSPVGRANESTIDSQSY